MWVQWIIRRVRPAPIIGTSAQVEHTGKSRKAAIHRLRGSAWQVTAPQPAAPTRPATPEVRTPRYVRLGYLHTCYAWGLPWLGRAHSALHVQQYAYSSMSSALTSPTCTPVAPDAGAELVQHVTTHSNSWCQPSWTLHFCNVHFHPSYI